MKYIVVGLIKQKGEVLKIGDTVEFTDDEGERLVRDGYLLPAAKEAPAAAAKPTVEAKLAKPAKAAKASSAANPAVATKPADGNG